MKLFVWDHLYEFNSGGDYDVATVMVVASDIYRAKKLMKQERELRVYYEMFSNGPKPDNKEWFRYHYKKPTYVSDIIEQEEKVMIFEWH
jgi:hypothetical protein